MCNRLHDGMGLANDGRAMKYRLLKPNEIVRKTDQTLYVMDGKETWWKVTGYGFKVKDCICRRLYRRKV